LSDSMASSSLRPKGPRPALPKLSPAKPSREAGGPTQRATASSRSLASRRHVRDKSISALVVILVLVAGASIGFALGNRHWTQKLIGLSYPRSDTTHEGSLRDYLALLDALQAGDASEVTRKIYAEDKALLLMRLADLEEQRGSSAESTRLTADALAVCSTAGLPYCSSVELRQRAHKLDVILERVKRSNRGQEERAQ
jgi:hypothetical protein